MRARLIVLMLVTLVGAVAPVAEAEAASAKRKQAIWGPARMPDRSSAFPIYGDLGVDFFQFQLVWERIARTRPANPTDPNDPAYHWSGDFDRIVSEARRYNIKVVFMVRASPPWANGGRPSQWVPNDRDYANFLIAASKRFPSVRYWMIWGEANRADVFQPLPLNSRVGPRRYAKLLRAGYNALKGRSRRNKVIGANTFSFGAVKPKSFIRWLRLPGGKPPPLDFYGHNPFSRRYPNLKRNGYRGQPGARDISDVDLLYKDLRKAYRRKYRRFRRRGPRLWLSEFTVSSDRKNRAHDFFVSRNEQARWLTAAYRIARKRYVASLGWFNLHDEPASQPNGLTTGLMTYEGFKKPAYFAYKRVR